MSRANNEPPFEEGQYFIAYLGERRAARIGMRVANSMWRRGEDNDGDTCLIGLGGTLMEDVEDGDWPDDVGYVGITPEQAETIRAAVALGADWNELARRVRYPFTEGPSQ